MNYNKMITLGEIVSDDIMSHDEEVRKQDIDAFLLGFNRKSTYLRLRAEKIPTSVTKAQSPEQALPSA